MAGRHAIPIMTLMLGAVAAERAFGLADLTHASFFTPPKRGNFIYGFGAMLTFPIATADVLGSDKWSAGSALRVAYRNGPWNIGFEE